MAQIDWRIRGPEIASCNCDWGCPCQFNARPTHGDCRAAVAMRIDQGHFGEVGLDGLHWVTLLAWPGAIHEGNGEALTIVEERADERQREALLKILAGEVSEPGATVFDVLASTLATIHEPRFLPIEFEADLASQTGRFAVRGVIETVAEPIRNPVTGAAHRARVVLPHGFEYTEAEFASSTIRTSEGPIPLHWANGHGHFAMLDLTPSGPVR